MKHNIDLIEFERVLDENKSAFLCGNGFSMNFDSNFSNIFDRLYDAHKELLEHSQYKVNAPKPAFNKKCKDNYKSAKQFFKHKSKEELYKIFEDGLLFAESIRENNPLINELWEKRWIISLEFGLSQYDLLDKICNIGRKWGVQYVNIEYWTILVYFYYAIKELKTPYYIFPIENSFIHAIKAGDKSEIKLTDVFFEKILFNGFCLYYRMLFSIAIFANGRGIDTTLLNKTRELDGVSIKNFLDKFDCLLSLNYDHLLEMISGRRVDHFHGEFGINKLEYVYYQSFCLKYKGKEISFSDILIGDYFMFKQYAALIQGFSEGGSKGLQYSMRKSFSNKMQSIVQQNRINTVVIFGMNIDNDQHVLRNLMVSFYQAKIKKPKIIYCYFIDQERVDFEEQYEAVITFGEELNTYARGIEVLFIKTENILNEYFSKNTVVQHIVN